MNERLPKFKGEKLLAEIEKSTAGLFYISETDAPIEPYSGGAADAVDVSHFIPNEVKGGTVQELSPKTFFARLTTPQDWYGAKEKDIARRFLGLESLLEENLDDLTVFRIGSIQIDIYVVGLDTDGDLVGIKTKAIET
jgi:hypothetical protein